MCEITALTHMINKNQHFVVDIAHWVIVFQICSLSVLMTYWSQTWHTGLNISFVWEI